MRKTKIICTIGPASEKPEVLRQLMESGMDVARENFSHGSHEEHKRRIDLIKKLREELGKPVAILLDTKGPEIRLGTFKGGKKYTLNSGDTFTLKVEDIEGDETQASVSFKELYKDMKPGDRILIDDGLIELTVSEIKGTDIVCHVDNGGPVSDRKGVNVPDEHVSLPFMNENDRADILFGIENNVDFIAASFVRCADDVRAIRNLLNENGGSNINIIAKIENREGIRNIDEIIEASEGIMVARGDMGVEIPFEAVPAIQKMIIKKVYEAGKVVVTATQMLDSMQQNPRPTRAEATDVANAIYDGTSAIMLSGETAAGKYPVEAVQAMARIAEATEADIDYRKRFTENSRMVAPTITDAVSHATVQAAVDLDARAIVAVTKSGRSARMISRFRPFCDIIACTVDAKEYQKLALSWGVIPVLVEEKSDLMYLIDYVSDVCRSRELLKKDDVCVFACGSPLGSGINMIRVTKI